MLAIGGLIRTNDADSINETPLLSRLPVIGWLFKRKAKTYRRTNLTVFIMPTIIEPRLRGGIGDYTRDYLQLTKQYAGSHLFGTLKDPITRWFFGTGRTLTDTFADEFIEHDEVHAQYGKNSAPTPKKRSSSNQIKEEHAAQKKAHAHHIRELIKDVKNPFEGTVGA